MYGSALLLVARVVAFAWLVEFDIGLHFLYLWFDDEVLDKILGNIATELVYEISKHFREMVVAKKPPLNLEICNFTTESLTSAAESPSVVFFYYLSRYHSPRNSSIL